MKALVLLALALYVPSVLAEKITDWQTGKLESLDSTSVPTVFGGYHAPVQSGTKTTCHIGIIAADTEYFADFHCNGRHGPQLTENAEIKYHAEKDTLWFLDESGKQYKCRIFKRRRTE